MNELESYLKERDAALLALDVDWGRKQMPGASEFMILLAMHKARVECATLLRDARLNSMIWLKAQDYGRMGGLPWPADGGLPE